MKKLFIYFLGLVLAVLMSACAMTTEVHFNKNYSGTYIQSIDIGDMIELVKDLSPPAEDGNDDDFIDEAYSEAYRKELLLHINQLDGISKASFDVINQTSIKFTFDFEDVESLNLAFSEIMSVLADQNEMLQESMSGMESLGLPRFTKNGKTISHGASFPADQIPDGALDEIDELGGDGTMAMLVEVMDYMVELSFDRKIKSVRVVGMDIISQDKHIVKARVDLRKLIKGEPYKIDVSN